MRLALIRLGDRRGRKFYSVEVARALGVPPMTFNAWENGRNEPSLATIVWLAAMLGVTPGWLAFGQLPERTPYTPVSSQRPPALLTLRQRSGKYPGMNRRNAVARIAGSVAALVVMPELLRPEEPHLTLGIDPATGTQRTTLCIGNHDNPGMQIRYIRVYDGTPTMEEMLADMRRAGIEIKVSENFPFIITGA